MGTQHFMTSILVVLGAILIGVQAIRPDPFIGHWVDTWTSECSYWNYIVISDIL